MTNTETKQEERPESRFVKHLLKLDAGDRAELRRSLAADKASDHLPAYRLIERFGNLSGWKRDCYYLVGALFAIADKRPPKKRGSKEEPPNETGDQAKSITFAKAVRAYEGLTQSGDGDMSSVERRFLNLLDSDRDQLAYRLRQMLVMVTRGQNAVNAPIDWVQLLVDLQYWRADDQDRVRQRWAQDFYRHSEPTTNQTPEENQP